MIVAGFGFRAGATTASLRAALVAAGTGARETMSRGEGDGLPLTTTPARLGGRGVDLGDLRAHWPSLRKAAAPGSPGTE